jgi:hypothetical protein
MLYHEENSQNYDFEKGDELSDLDLIVEGKCLHVHKAILGIHLKLNLN